MGRHSSFELDSGPYDAVAILGSAIWAVLAYSAMQEIGGEPDLLSEVYNYVSAGSAGSAFDVVVNGIQSVAESISDRPYSGRPN